MAANTYVNKVVLADGRTLIDLTGDDVTESDVLSGIKFHKPDGSSATGECTYDADTSDGTATAAEIIEDATAYVNGQAVVGTMPNREGYTAYISDKDTPVSIPYGYHDGSGSIGIDSTEAAKLIAANIKSGITILGVTGSYTGEEILANAVYVTPYFTSQTILPPGGYDYISQVNVYEITVTETDNAAGGVTVTIGDSVPVAS